MELCHVRESIVLYFCPSLDILHFWFDLRSDRTISPKQLSEFSSALRLPDPSPRASQEVQHIDPAQFRLPIVSVALLPARHDVFDRRVVQSVLAVATPIDVVLMAVVFPQQSVDSASFSGIELVPSAGIGYSVSAFSGCCSLRVP